MDHDVIVVFLVPIIAIVMGVGSRMLKTWTNHEQEMARIRASKQAAPDGSSLGEIAALRDEIAQLRDTTTQYDMSVERALQELRHRIENVEQKTVALPPAAAPRVSYPAPKVSPVQLEGQEQGQEQASTLSAGG